VENFEGPAPRALERLEIGLDPDGQLVVNTAVRFRRELGVLGLFYGLGLRFFGHIVAAQGRITQFLWRRDLGLASFSPGSFRAALGRRRYYVAGFFYVTMIGLAIKIFLRLVLHIQYIVRLPWINANV
jgi:hypothetical protein